MSIIKNSLANYIGTAAAIGFGIVVTPLYFQYLGPESFGLIGFFALIQSWSILMDMGLSPTLGRQVANARGQGAGFNPLKRLLRSFELIFLFLAVLIALVILLSSNWLSTNWIKSENLDRETVAYCIYIMAGMIGLRFFSSLYRSGINGFEDQVWLNQVNIILLTTRYLGSIFLLAYHSADIRNFFEFQLLISLVEPVVLGARLYRNLPKTRVAFPLFFFDWAEVRRITPYALSVAYSAGIWILVTQTDRLILSGLLNLKEFGYLTLVMLVTSGITLISQPIGAAIRPRMTVLFAQKEKAGFIELYRQSSKTITWIAFSAAIIVGLNAESLLYAFSGNLEASHWGAKITIWFALGNALLAVSAFQFYLQTAVGDLKLHLKGATVTAAIQFPAIAFSAFHYGALGAGICWFCMRLVFFLFWTPIVHDKFLPEFHRSWLFKDIIPVLSLSLVIGILLSYFSSLSIETNRVLLFSKLIGLGCLQLLLTSSVIQALGILNFNPKKLLAGRV